MTNACNALLASTDYVANWGVFSILAHSGGSRLFIGKAMYANNGNACLQYTKASIVNPMKDISLGTNGVENMDLFGCLGNLDRSWYFQKCTEFAYFQVGYPGTSVFFGDMPSTMQEEFCLETFGRPLVPHVDWTNAYYGGKPPSPLVVWALS
jgi:hypothetical protein